MFWLKRRPRHRAANPSTIFTGCGPTGYERPSCRALFLLHYPAVRDALAVPRGAGFALLAVDAQGLQAMAHLGAHPDSPNCAILGRHSRAELTLRDDGALSLRHLALLVSPTPEGAKPRLRVVDLRSGLGFADEHGRSRRGLEADGAVLLTCGRYALMAFPVPPGGPLPDDPLQGWESLPAREYPDADRIAAGATSPRPDDSADRTLVRGLSGPRDLHEGLLDGGEWPLGVLVLRSDRGDARVSVGRRALRDGLLLGRAPRCEGAELLDSPHISRVHLLLIELSGSVYAVDTASYNGTSTAGDERRVRRLESGVSLELARGEAEVEWEPVH